MDGWRRGWWRPTERRHWSWLLLVLGRTYDRPDHLSRVVEDLNGDLIDRVLEKVLDNRVFHPPHSAVRLEQGQVGLIDLRCQLSERVDVVQDPEAPAVRAHHHVVVLHHQIPDRRVR